MPNLKTKNDKTINSFKSLIDSLPFNTIDIRRELAKQDFIDRSTIDKWYNGTSPLKNAYTIAKVAEFLNENYPNKEGVLIRIEDLLG